MYVSDAWCWLAWQRGSNSERDRGMNSQSVNHCVDDVMDVCQPIGPWCSEWEFVIIIIIIVILNEYYMQFGFMKGKGTTDAIFMARHAGEF